MPGERRVVYWCSVERIAQDVAAKDAGQSLGRRSARVDARRERGVLRRLQRQGFVRRVLVGGWQITEAGLGRLRGLGL